MKSQRDKPPFLIFAVLFLVLLLVAIGLSALDASAAGGAHGSAGRGQEANSESGAAITSLAQGFAEYHRR
jgi:hypothetical protein